MAEGETVAAQHHVAPADARSLRRGERSRGRGIDDAQGFVGATAAHQRRDEFFGHRA